MQEQAFSLLAFNWLPASSPDGVLRVERPSRLLNASVSTPLLGPAWPRPDFDAATLEFLIGLVSTACHMRVADPDGWDEWWHQPPTVDELDAAFAPFAEAFELDGDGPRFMQDRSDLGAEPTPVSSLLIDSPGANALKKNRDLFVRRGGVQQLGRPAAAMALFTLQTYAPAGGAGHRTSLRGGGPLTSLVLPPSEQDTSTLWHLVWLNAVWDAAWPDPTSDLGQVFPWLTPTRTSEGGQITTPADVHPAQCFWGTPRRIRLDFEPVSEAPMTCSLTRMQDRVVVATYRTRPHGTNYEAWSQGHPLSPYYRSKKDQPEWLPVHPQPGHAGYRDWVGLVVSDGDDAPMRAPARAVRQARDRLRRLRLKGAARVWVGGFDMDNMAARGFVESALPLRITEPRVQQTIDVLSRRLVLGAREAEGLVSYAVASALTPGDAGSSDKGQRRIARERFWERTEGPFFTTLDDTTAALQAPDAPPGAEILDRTIDEWLGVLRRHGLELFDQLVPFDDVGLADVERLVDARRSLHLAFRGYGQGGQRLFKALNLPLPAAKPKRRTRTEPEAVA